MNVEIQFIYSIFVTNEYQLKIGDFGLVKVVGDRTVTGTFVGTRRYMSPPELKEDGVQRDVYAQIKEADISVSFTCFPMQ